MTSSASSSGSRGAGDHATEWFFGTSYQYLTSYKGLAFYTKSPAPLDLPSDTELVQAKSISVPRSRRPRARQESTAAGQLAPGNSV